MRGLLLIAGLLCCIYTVNAQKAATPKGYKHLKSGIDYRIVRDIKGKKTANNTDIVMLHMLWKIKDSVYFDSRKINNDQPLPYKITGPQFPSDPVEVLKLLTAGDSAVILVPIDSFNKSGQKIPAIDGAKMMEFNVSVISVNTQQELKDEAATQRIKDDSLIRDYLKRNKLEDKAKKTASGLYYIIYFEGIGDYLKNGDKIAIGQVGMLLNGDIFDANMGPNANTKTLLDAIVGNKNLLPAWNEGLPLLKKGAKATLFIPSHLAFGTAGKDKVPPNSVIITHIEISNAK